MIDLSEGTKPKSDQLNADDLIGGPMTIEVTEVKDTGADQQRYWVHFVGDNGKPWKPCKSMLRVLVHLWGKDGTAYSGRRLTLFCDPTVTFGPDTTGGIRISHMSDIAQDTTVPLTVKRGKKKPYHVRKLASEKPKQVAQETSTKQPGNIASARVMLDGSDAGTVEFLLKGLREQSWTKEEAAELKTLAESAKKRKPTQPEESK